MIKNYLTTAWRNLVKNKAHSFINIAGLSVGMAVALLIGLWVHDELTFNKNFPNYNRIGQLWQFVKFDVEKTSYDAMPIPLAQELRTKYPEFKAVSLSKPKTDEVVAYGDKKFAETGNYAEPDFPEMLSLKMIGGSRNALKDVNSIMLSRSLAAKLFDKGRALNKMVKLGNKLTVKVSAIYENFPDNSTFKDVQFIAPWDQYANSEEWIKNSRDEWDNNSWNIFVQLKDGADFHKTSATIKDIRMKKADPPRYKPEFFVHPMSRWHLYSEFKNGVNTGGAIQNVWLFGIIGVFVLLLACINFMNLSTARSEKRAREVGIRKAIGSMRRQLIIQFFSESLLVVALAFVLSLGLVVLMLPFFNGVADKKISVLWLNPLFWSISLLFIGVTGLIAGSYPALYLSSFQPIKVLKGAFRVGRFASVPRKVLVVVQFTVSVILIIGTIIVFRQIQFSKNRPVGYERQRLIEVPMNTPEVLGQYETLRQALLNTGAVSDVSESSGSITVQYGGTTDISWKGKAPDSRPLVMRNQVTHDYGKTVNWQMLKGRDFSRDFGTDTSAIILNEAAQKLMGFKNPAGELVQTGGIKRQVIGVVKDMIKESPFKQPSPSVFILDYKSVNIINIKLAATAGVSEALAKVETVFKKFNPESPFTYNFVDEEYNKKFQNEERIGKLAGFFAVLAIFISCLGLFGMASFMAEQRTKEIGVRKVLGASVLSLWELLSKEFVMLVVISFLIAAPMAYYFMHNWLNNYEYRTGLSWWIFAGAGAGALAITLCTVSFQAIKAALANPVRSLRTE